MKEIRRCTVVDTAEKTWIEEIRRCMVVDIAEKVREAIRDGMDLDNRGRRAGQ
jgi:hypothetical protein